jgi:hypothetical protein
MAKVYESEIDPDEFIRSFREESSSLSTLKKKPKAEGLTQESEPETTKVPSSKSVSESQPNESVGNDADRERFVWNMTYMSPQDKYVTTEIDPEIEWKIRRILFCRKKGRVCSLKAFINNVLAAHLEEYADVINQLKL